MNRIIAAALIAVFPVMASAADQTCSPEDAQAKAMELSTALQSLAASDPARMQEIATEMQTKAVELQTSGDMAGLCAYYDQLMADMQS